MILLSGNPIAIFVGLGFYFVVFFIVWTILFYFFEKANGFNITNKSLKRIAYVVLALTALILSFIACGMIFGML